MECETICAELVLHFALTTDSPGPHQRICQMYSENCCLFTPSIYHYTGQQVTVGPGQKVLAFLCNRMSTLHICHPTACQLVPTGDEQYMCLVFENKSTTRSVQIDTLTSLMSLITTMPYDVVAMNKENFFFTGCRQCLIKK